MTENYWDFLKYYLPKAAICANTMNQFFFVDPGVAVSRSRIFLEEIINSVLEKEEIVFDRNPPLFEKIGYLKKEDYITNETYESFSLIRRVGNKGSHQANYTNMQDAYSVHKEMYNVAKWYIEVYCTYDEKLPIYEQPKVPLMAPPPEVAVTLEDPVVKPVELSSRANNSVEKEKSTYEYEKLRGSYLEREISRLKISSAEAVDNAESFSSFQKYMHVKRPIQDKLEAVLTEHHNSPFGNLILLCGSVGDGKSHLLAYFNEKHQELMEDYRVYNDATESYSPSKTALETLEHNLRFFSDQKIKESNEKVIIAINSGVLHNFIHYEHENYTFNKFKDFVKESKIFTPAVVAHYGQDNFNILSFLDYQTYELKEDGVESMYYKQILQNIVQEKEDNPFYIAYKMDVENNTNKIVHQNYRFLKNPVVQNQIVQLIIEAMVTQKTNISSREYLNFISDILLTEDVEADRQLTSLEEVNASLPNVLFGQENRSEVLRMLSKLHPLHRRSPISDNLLVRLNSITRIEELVEETIISPEAKKWILPLIEENGVSDSLIELYVSTLYLTDKQFIKDMKNKVYEDYLKYLFAFNVRKKDLIREFDDILTQAIFNWKGTPLEKYIYVEYLASNISLAQELSLKLSIANLVERRESILNDFFTTISVVYKGRKNEHSQELSIDYSLYKLLVKVVAGYRPNIRDLEEAITFTEDIERLMDFGNQNEELLFEFIDEQKKYKLELESFDGESTFIFKKVN